VKASAGRRIRDLEHRLALTEQARRELQERATGMARREGAVLARLAEAEREVARVLAGAGVTRHPLYAPG
jgi:hypothetical protein